MQLVKEQGGYLFAQLQVNFLRMLTELSECKNLRFLPLDAGQDILLKKYHLQLEMAAADHCLAMFTIGDSDEAYRRMTDALLTIDRDITAGKWQGQGAADGRADREPSLYQLQKKLMQFV